MTPPFPNIVTDFAVADPVTQRYANSGQHGGQRPGQLKATSKVATTTLTTPRSSISLEEKWLMNGSSVSSGKC